MLGYLLTTTTALSAESGITICKQMAKPIENLGLSSKAAQEYVFDVVSAIRSGNYMDYLEVDTPEHGKRYLTTDMLLSERFYLRPGRTQIVNFDMLKRLPRSSVKMDYLVAITPEDTIDERRVNLVISKANKMGVRFFPIWAARTSPTDLLKKLAKETRGELIDLSGRMNPCAKASLAVKMDKPFDIDAGDEALAKKDLETLKNYVPPKPEDHPDNKEYLKKLIQMAK
jgi:hypothetical protein